MPSYYLTVNDAVRAKIDELVESKGLDAKDYPYSSDAAISLNQLSVILGGSGNSQSIADSVVEVLKNVGGSSGGSSSSGPILEWEQLIKPEDTFYINDNGFPSIDIDDFFGWKNTQDIFPWALLKLVYNEKTYYTFGQITVTRNYTNTSEENIFATDLTVDNTFNDTYGINCSVVYNHNQSKFDSVTIIIYSQYNTINFTSGVSIYGAKIIGWND